MAEPRRIYVGLGANLGKPYATFHSALAVLEGKPIRLLRLSPIYRTAPVGSIPQPDYLNAVAELETALPPAEVLPILLETETRFGRDRANEQRWGPRTLDLDYLLDESSLAIAIPHLTLPHPRLWERAFVLSPLSDLRSDLVGPDGLPIPQLAAKLRTQQPIHGPLTENEAAGYPGSQPDSRPLRSWVNYKRPQVVTVRSCS